VGVVLVWAVWPTTPPPSRMTHSAGVDQMAVERAQAYRQRMIEKFTNDGFFSRVQLRGTGPHLWVTARFDELDDNVKQEYVAVVQAYYATKSPGAEKVTLYKVGSAEKIGYYVSGGDGLTLY